MKGRITEPSDEGRRLVVTDRYLPNAHGGAEISLHAFLRQAKIARTVLVAAFNEEVAHPRRYTQDGVPVIELPTPAPWPYHGVALARFTATNQRKRPYRIARKLIWLGRYVVSRPYRYGPHRLDMLHRRYVKRTLPHMLNERDEFPQNVRTKLLRRLVEEMRPAVLHADNYRSILAVAEARRTRPQTPAVATVRDNRFYCMRADQAMHIGGNRCGVCHFECVPRDRAERATVVRDAEVTRAYRQTALRSFDRIVTTSAFLREQVDGFANAAVVSQIANMADSIGEVEGFVSGVAEIPGFNVLVIGMINENKGQRELCARLPDLVSRVPNAKLYIAGRGDRIRKAIEEEAARNGVADHIEFLGYLDRAEIYRWLRRCQVVAAPTIWPEPFGRTPLEAGAARRPIVSFATGGLKETIIDEKTGYLVDAGDFDAFIDRLARLSADPGLRFRMGQAAFTHIKQRYGRRELGQTIEALWRDVAS